MNIVEAHNEWALDNILPGNRMLCKGCGVIVASDWIDQEFSEEIGEICGPCNNKLIKEKKCKE